MVAVIGAVELGFGAAIGFTSSDLPYARIQKAAHHQNVMLKLSRAEIGSTGLKWMS